MKNRYPTCGAGDEKEFVSSSSQASVRWHLDFLSLNQSPWLRGLGSWTEHGRSQDTKSQDTKSQDTDSLANESKALLLIDGTVLSETCDISRES